MSNKDAYTGSGLDDFITRSSDIHHPLISGFIHEKSVILFSADPGAGKSTVVACWIAQASAGLPVFGQLFVPRPLVIYYIPFERGAAEIAERWRYIREVIPMNCENIFVNDNFMGMNVNSDSHANNLIGSIRSQCKDVKIDIMILDPIYACVKGGLSKDEPASAFTQFSTRLQTEFDCAMFLVHHTSRDVYASDGSGKIDRDDPFYGSQWLKAHCTGAYIMRSKPEGRVLLCKKDNHNVLTHIINLEYDHDNYTVYMPSEIDDEMPYKDRLTIIYRLLKKDNKSATFKQIQGALKGVSHAHLRRLLDTPPWSSAFKKCKTIGSATLYTPTTEI